MKSPFPGMDPYLDAHWLDVHTSLVTDARNTLNERLPEDLAASSEERVAVESSDEAREKHYYLDVRVFKPGGGVKTPPTNSTPPAACSSRRCDSSPSRSP